jgi:unsaturated pyranuronate lyase
MRPSDVLLQHALFTRLSMPFLDQSNAPSFQPAPGCRLSTHAGEHLMLSWVEMDAGAAIPLHQHPHEQGGTVIEGKLQLTIGDETQIIQRGTTYFVPSNAPHRAVAVDGPVVVLDTFSPIRDDYVEQMKQSLV